MRCLHCEATIPPGPSRVVPRNGDDLLAAAGGGAAGAGGGAVMNFFTVVDQVVELLRSRGRVSYRAPRVQFDLDPEDWREVVRAYQEACATVIARYDGHTAHG